jgi:hypothetical protein
MINLNKLKEDTKILLETKESIFEIEVLNPKTGKISIVGGRRFPTHTKAKIVGSRDEHDNLLKLEIHRNMPLEIEYKEGTTNNAFVTSTVVSAKLSGVLEGKPWEFEVWGKPDISAAISEAKKRL